jgi:hypothetical protein
MNGQDFKLFCDAPIGDNMDGKGLRHVVCSIQFVENYPRFKERQHRAQREKTILPSLRGSREKAQFCA